MKKVCIIGCFILFLLCLAGCNTSSTVKDNNAVFSEAVKATSGDIITLNKLAAFEWDIAYTFTPNTPKKTIEKIIGVSGRDIKETYNESQTQLIFVKDNKVVCSIWGYGNNLGYWIFFRGYDGDYLAIKPNDDVSFSVDRSGEEIMLTYAPETITQSLINDLVAECQATDDIIGIKNADFSLDKDGNLKTADITVWGFYQHFGKHEPPEDFWREISVEINANGAVTATDIPYGQDGYARLLSKYYPIEDKGGSMLTPQNFSDAVNSLKIDGIIVKENLSADGYRLLYRCAAELFDGFNIDNIERCHIVTKYSVGKAETPAGIADLYDNCFILVPYKGGNADLTNMVALIIEFLI